MNNFISIIIPTYNSSKYIDRTLGSLKKQIYKYFEVIIIDNNSSDNTKKIISNYNSSLDIKIININNFGIIAKSRNLGINSSKGSIISFLDSDDYWIDNKLFIINDVFSSEKYDVCCHNEIAIDGNYKDIKKMKYGSKAINFYEDLLIFGNSLSTSAVSIKKEFLIRNNLFFSERKEYITAEDYDLWIKLAQKNAKFKFINKYLGYYQVDDKSSSNIDIEKHHGYVENVVNEHLKIINSKRVKKLTKARITITKLKLLLKNNKIKTFFEIINKFKISDFKFIIKFIFLKIIRRIYG